MARERYTSEAPLSSTAPRRKTGSRAELSPRNVEAGLERRARSCFATNGFLCQLIMYNMHLLSIVLPGCAIPRRDTG